MTTFDDREKAEEARFAAAETRHFRATSMRDQMLGQWAAGKLGLTGQAASAYAKGVADAGLVAHGEVAVLAKLARDFAAAGLPVGEGEIRAMLTEKMTEAEKRANAEG